MSSEVEKGLVSLITTNSPQTSAAARMYPRLPQGITFPAIRYQRISSERFQALDANVGVNNVTIQVDCMADSYSESKVLADEVRVILHGYSGSWGTLTCHLCVMETENDLEYMDGDDVLHWVSQRYRIHTDME